MNHTVSEPHLFPSLDMSVRGKSDKRGVCERERMQWGSQSLNTGLTRWATPETLKLSVTHTVSESRLLKWNFQLSEEVNSSGHSIHLQVLCYRYWNKGLVPSGVSARHV
jgi:hypothetical protein